MRKRSVTEYHEPVSLDDLRRITDDHVDYPGQTRVWIRPGRGEDGDTYTVCLSTPPRSPEA